MTNWTTRRAILSAIIIFILSVPVALYFLFPRHDPNLLVEITTIGSVPFGSGPLSLRRIPILEHFPHSSNTPMVGLFPVDVNENQEIYVGQSTGVLRIKPGSNSVSRIPLKHSSDSSWPWMRIHCGANNSLWISRNIAEEYLSRVTQLDQEGNVLCQLKWSQKPVRRNRKPTQPSSDPEADKEIDLLEPDVDIFPDGSDGVFILTEDLKLSRFNIHGQLVSTYDGLSSPDSNPTICFSAAVGPDNEFFSIASCTTNGNGEYTSLQIKQWSSSAEKKVQEFKINLSTLPEPPLVADLLLRSATRDALYFQYLYPQKGAKRVWFDQWFGPMAIARYDRKDGSFSKILDIYQLYEKQIEKAKKVATPTRKSLGPIGVGDLIRVDDTEGLNLYIEVADEKNYRVDKLSLPLS